MNTGQPSERAIQRSILKAMARALPERAFWFHVANQTLAPADYVGALKGDGLKSGVPDLILVLDGRVYGLEVKRRGEDLSDDQRTVHAKLEAAGCPCATIRSVQDAEAAWARWGLPTAT